MSSKWKSLPGENCICMRNIHTLEEAFKESRFQFPVGCLFTPQQPIEIHGQILSRNPGFHAPSCAFSHLLRETASEEGSEHTHRLSRSQATDKRTEAVRRAGSNQPVSVLPQRKPRPAQLQLSMENVQACPAGSFNFHLHMHRNIRGSVIPLLSNQGDLKKENKPDKTPPHKNPRTSKQAEAPSPKD